MLRKTLATLPPTLDQTYDCILSAISEEDSDYAMRILQWLAFSERPLSVEEIAEVVALDTAREPAFDRDEVLEDPLEVLNICSSLVTVTVVMTRHIVALAHYSVQEYLVSYRIKQGPAKQYAMEEVECQTSITKGCLKYLAQLQQPLSESILQASALAKYVARFWSVHLRKTANEMEELSHLALDLLLADKAAYFTWLQLSNPDWPEDKPNLKKVVGSVAAPIYYAALLDLSTITKMLLDQSIDINAQGGEFGNALQAASQAGHERLVGILLDNKTTNVNARGGYYGNALQAASFEGHEQIVQMLLSNADVNAQGGPYGNALQAASLGGHERIVKLLLDKNASINAQGGKYGNALQAASWGRHEQVVQLLLNDADVNAQGGMFGNALQAASHGGNERIVKLLLDKNANVHAQGGAYDSALQAAAMKGHAQVIKLLLESGADPNAQVGIYANALQVAASEGHAQVVQILLERGAEVNAQGGYFGSALQAASYGRYKHVVEILLASQADVNVQGGYHGTALQAASRRGHVQIVQMLLDSGADVYAQGGARMTALSAASGEGHTQVVKMLLGNKADVNTRDGRWMNDAMKAAQTAGHRQILGLLLARSAEQEQEKGLTTKATRASPGSGTPVTRRKTATAMATPIKSHTFPQALTKWLPTSRANKLENRSRY